MIELYFKIKVIGLIIIGVIMAVCALLIACVFIHAKFKDWMKRKKRQERKGKYD